MIDVLTAQYLACLDAEGRSPRTLRWHLHSIAQFARWLEAEGRSTDPREWTPALLREWIVHTRTRPAHRGGTLSAASVNSLVRSLRAFCNWLYAEGFLDEQPFARVKVPKSPKVVRATLSPEEVAVLLTRIRGGSRNRLRNEALLLFGLDSGARASEVVRIRPEHIDWQRNATVVTGKGSKQRVLPFSPATGKAMLKYASKERPGGEFFFVTETGAALTASGLGQIYKRLTKATGIKVHPHLLRHTAATEYARSGASAVLLQRLLGHSSIATSLIYTHLGDDALLDAHQRHSPLRRLRAS